jgi:hypothetical protein
MKKNSRENEVAAETEHNRGDRSGRPVQPLLCVDQEGEVIEEGRVRTEQEAIRRPFLA